jgi:hypothetical protein
MRFDKKRRSKDSIVTFGEFEREIRETDEFVEEEVERLEMRIDDGAAETRREMQQLSGRIADALNEAGTKFSMAFDDLDRATAVRSDLLEGAGLSRDLFAHLIATVCEQGDRIAALEARPVQPSESKIISAIHAAQRLEAGENGHRGGAAAPTSCQTRPSQTAVLLSGHRI